MRIGSFFKKAIPSILAAILLTSIVLISVTAAGDGDNAPTTCQPGDPTVLYNNILNSFKEDPSDPTLDTACFSALFGGAYTNEDYQLVIVVNADEITDEIRSEFYRRAGLTESGGKKAMDFIAGKFEYQHLLDVYEKTCQYMIETPKEDWIPFNGIWIDDALNRVVISIHVLNDETVGRIKREVIDDEAVLIIEDPREIILELFSSATPGNGISGGNLTAGYRAQSWNGTIGFVTAGHGFTGTGQAVYLQGSSSVFGYVLNHSVGDMLDAAFVVPSSGNTVNANTLHTNFINVPAQGDTIYKKGIGTGTTSGTVISNNYTVPGTNRHNLIKTNPMSGSGDSGGPAWCPAKQSAAVGIVLGGEMQINNNGTTQVSSLFTRADKIYALFNELAPY